MRRSLTLIAVAALAAAAPLSPALAGPEDRGAEAEIQIPKLTAEQAFEKAKAGEILLVDVRPAEAARALGLPEGAEAVDFFDSAFYDIIDVLTEGDRDTPVALICFTGGRSLHAAKELAKRGYTRTYDVPEGINGSAAGPGWKARGLPMVKPGS